MAILAPLLAPDEDDVLEARFALAQIHYDQARGLPDAQRESRDAARARALDEARRVLEDRARRLGAGHYTTRRVAAWLAEREHDLF